MPTDDPRVKRVLKRYLKTNQFSDASLELTGISLEELQTALRSSPNDNLVAPQELDEPSLAWLTKRMQMVFDAQTYDFFLHSYARREFCSDERVPEEDLRFSCEDGPPKRIPLEKGLKWVSVRPENGKESYIGIEDDQESVS